MTSSAFVETSEAGALAARMAKHFGHKVKVERQGDAARISIPAGTFALEPSAEGVILRAEAVDMDALARVEEVAASHLERFARGAPVSVSWTRL